jgi:opacity protein-like surface antigen
MASAPPAAWTGPYAGVSLGIGALNANTSGTGTNIQNSTNTDLLGNITQLSTFTGVQAFGDNRAKAQIGALADVYVGYSSRFGNWVGGGQLEGSLGRFFSRFDQDGIFASSNVTKNFNNGVLLLPVATGFDAGSGTVTNSLNIDFMVSAIARFGYLVTPRDLVYGLGGWTYAGFNTTLPAAIDPSFGAHGVTVGAGWEREMLDGWTLKAEYRYTKFQGVDVDVATAQRDTSATSTNLFTSQATAHISPDLHVVRVGLTHYFGQDWSGAGYASSDAGYYKAPVPVFRSWTGTYAGLSVGAGGMDPNASSVAVGTNTFNRTTGPNLTVQTFDTLRTTDGNAQFRPGGVADLFLGYDQQVNTWVAGVQIEGSVARFNERLRRTSTSNFVNTFQQFANGVPVAPVVTALTTTVATDDRTLTANWMVTAIGRLGVLVDPRNLIYGLGGVTFANFQTSVETEDVNRTFNTYGPTVGLGWEMQLPDMWTFRTEYRYTKFINRTLTTSTPFSDRATDNAGTVTTSVQTFDSSTTVSSDSHIVRLGVARQFSP